MKAPAKKVLWRSVLRLLVWVAGIYYVFSRFLPCTPVADYPSFSNFDDDWAQALAVAFVRHWQFGRDVVFTYGPWGFLARGYYPATYFISVAAWAVLSVVFLCAGWRLARHLSSHWLVAWLWLIGFTAAASLPVGDDFNNRLVAFGLLLLFLHFFVNDRVLPPIEAVLVVALGWLSLVKFTGLLVSGVLVAIIAAETIIRHKRFPMIVLWWSGSLLLFWILAGQSPGLLPQFLHSSWQITSGYTEAMMLDGPTGVWNMAGYWVLASLLCVLTGLLAWPRHRVLGVLPLAGLGTVLLLAFKLGYVRNDWHELDSAMALLLVALAGLAVAWPATRPKAILGLGLAVGSGLFAAFVFQGWFPNDGLPRQVANTFGTYRLMAPVMSLSTGYLRNEYEKSLAHAKRDFPLPALQGGTDIYSYDQNLLFANGLAYQPRPVMQSYSAYTPELAELNAAQLRTGRAADNILFAIQPLDHRFPSLDDGRSWPELLTRYDVKAVLGTPEKYLLLSRAAAPRAYHLNPLTNTAARFGEPLEVPAATHGPVWVELEINPSPMGKLMATFYKPPMLRLTVSLRDQRQLHFRLVPGLARGGFLLSPLVENIHSFAALAGADRRSLINQEITAMTLAADTESGLTRCYQSPVPVRFFQLDYPAQILPSAVSRSPAEPLPAR